MVEKIEISISGWVSEHLLINHVQPFWTTNFMCLEVQKVLSTSDRQVNHYLKWDDIIYLQISKINGCVLERIADLQFGFAYGACGTFTFPEERVVFCFGNGSEQKCFRYMLYHIYNQSFIRLSVIMVKPLIIFQTQNFGINVQLLATSRTMFWLLEAVGLRKIIKWKFWIFRQTLGQPEQDILFAPFGKFSPSISFFLISRNSVFLHTQQ